MATLVEIRDSILLELKMRQARRHLYDGIEWIDDERAVMLRETNAWRSRLGKSPVTESDIRRVETQACGHVDYSSKFALYCAELALGMEAKP